MAQLRIDIVIPTYNEENFIGDLLWDVMKAKQSEYMSARMLIS